MAAGQMSEMIQHLREAALRQGRADLSDGQLLACFIKTHDEEAIEALVRRHGPMIWGVCRRILHSHQDAEDAFQATFLVLVRKAASIVPREMVANWLYGVAHQTALKARAVAIKRSVRERQVMDMPEPDVREHSARHDLQPLLDQELSRLPDKYRILIVLCDLEGKTRNEVAEQLHLPEGTVAGRLARARAMLTKRLGHHGLLVSGGILAGLLSAQAASASLPTTVICSTINAASALAAGKVAATGVISVNAAALSEGVLKAMFLSKLKIASVCLMAIGLFGIGMGLLFNQSSAAQQNVNEGNAKVTTPLAVQQPVSQEKEAKGENQKNEGQQNQQGKEGNQKDDGQQNQKDDGQKNQNDDGQKNQNDDGPKNQKDDGQKGTVQSVDTSKNTITVVTKKAGKDVSETFPLLNPSVSIAGKAANVNDLKAGMPVILRLSTDNKKVVEIRSGQGK